MTEPAASLDPASLRGLAEDVLDSRLRAFANQHGAGALPALSGLAEGATDRAVRRAAKRALYRLSQRGVAPAAAPRPVPVVQRRAPRAVRAWLSGIDGSGSRAAWILFEGPYGGGALCSLILNDVIGIAEVAGGDITKRRLEAELAALRAAQKLPWVESEPARAVGLVAEALELHRERGTQPPAAFGRWQPFFAEASSPPPRAEPVADPALAARSAELLALPEMAGWFLDPETVQSDALEVQEAREPPRGLRPDQGGTPGVDPHACRRARVHARGPATLVTTTRRHGVDLRGDRPPRSVGAGVGGRRRIRRARRRPAPPAARPRPRPACLRGGRRGRRRPSARRRREPQALITDVPGVRVGHATDLTGLTGVTVVLCERPAVCGVELRGGANDVVGLDYLDARHLVPTVNGVVLGGGSRFGGEAIWGVMRWLEARGQGFAAGPAVVPHVPGAFLFDLNVGDSRARPTREMGYEAVASAAGGPVAEGNVGAGTGATVGKVYRIGRAMRGGLGTASVRRDHLVVGALVAVNAVGDVRDPDSGALIAGAREAPESHRLVDSARALASNAVLERFAAPANTTIGVVATNARLGKAEAAKLASLAMLGYAHALSPPHTAFDGDTLFALSVGDVPADLTRLGLAAAEAVARAIVRGVRAATGLPGIPAARDL